MEIFADDIQMSATTIKHATGTVFIICMAGSKIKPIARTQWPHTAKQLPSRNAVKKPIPILNRDCPMESQKSKVVPCRNKLCMVSNGPANKKSGKKTAKIDQTAVQKRTTVRRVNSVLYCIEIFFRQFSANKSGIIGVQCIQISGQCRTHFFSRQAN